MAMPLSLKLSWVFIATLMILSPWIAEKTDFTYTLLANENFWFEELLTEQIGVHSTVIVPTRMASLRVFDANGQQIYYKEREEIMEHSFTSTVGGFYKFCLLNYARTYTKCDVKIRSGVDAHNYDNLVTQKKLKPVELQATKIEDQSRELKKYYHANKKREQILASKLQWITTHQYRLIGGTIFLQLVTTVLWVFVLRYYFNKKKKI